MLKILRAVPELRKLVGSFTSARLKAGLVLTYQTERLDKGCKAISTNTAVHHKRYF